MKELMSLNEFILIIIFIILWKYFSMSEHFYTIFLFSNFFFFQKKYLLEKS